MCREGKQRMCCMVACYAAYLCVCIRGKGIGRLCGWAVSPARLSPAQVTPAKPGPPKTTAGITCVGDIRPALRLMTYLSHTACRRVPVSVMLYSCTRFSLGAGVW